jgi:hypothetical protein
MTDQRVNPAANDSDAIRWASSNGHHEVVRLLLSDQRVNPAAEDNGAIKWASRYGRLEVVRLLLFDQRVNPAAEENNAINGHQGMVISRLLVCCCRIKELIQQLVTTTPSNGQLDAIALMLLNSFSTTFSSNQRIHHNHPHTLKTLSTKLSWKKKTITLYSLISCKNHLVLLPPTSYI